MEVPTTQGTNRFSVRAYNSEGEGEALDLEVFTGDDIPPEPTNVRMEVRDGKAYLSWDAPTEGENGDSSTRDSHLRNPAEVRL